MTLLFQKKYPVVLAAAVLSCMAASERLAAATNVTYAAFGTFSSPQISGADVFQLRGQPFSINVVASETLVSKNHGAQWALYTMLKMTGTVQSGLLPTPIAISSNSSSILLAAGNPSQDSFMLGSPVKVVGTTLGINGTLTATVPGTAADVSVRLHGDGAQAITMHADGAQSVQSIGARSVDLGTPSDVVVLQFYASGVRDAGEVRVQIGGEDAAVLYAGAAERFSGLDQVSVQVPRSLAGRGAVEVLLTVGGQTAGPVRLQIQ